jgi:hypothetical protein
MLVFWLILIAIVLLISFYLWPKDQRSLVIVIITGVIISSLAGAGIIIAKSIPVTRKETVEKVVVLKRKKPPRVVYKDRIVYQTPGKEVSSVDVKGACQGEVPLQIVKIDEQKVPQSSLDKEAGIPAEHTTWVLAHPVGSKVLITCGQPGAYADFWKVGDVIQITTGMPQ